VRERQKPCQAVEINKKGQVIEITRGIRVSKCPTMGSPCPESYIETRTATDAGLKDSKKGSALPASLDGNVSVNRLDTDTMLPHTGHASAVNEFPGRSLGIIPIRSISNLEWKIAGDRVVLFAVPGIRQLDVKLDRKAGRHGHSNLPSLGRNISTPPRAVLGADHVHRNISSHGLGLDPAIDGLDPDVATHRLRFNKSPGAPDVDVATHGRHVGAQWSIAPPNLAPHGRNIHSLPHRVRLARRPRRSQSAHVPVDYIPAHGRAFHISNHVLEHHLAPHRAERTIHFRVGEVDLPPHG